jgi:hypothetical protein
VDIVASLEAAAEPSELVKPGIRTLDHPAVFPQPTPMFGAALGNIWFDPARPEGQPVGARVIGAIGVQPIWPAPRAAYSAADGRDGVDQRQDLRDVVFIGPRNNCRHGEAMAFRKDVVLAAVFAPIRGAGACFFPRAIARIEVESTTARRQSSFCASLSLAKRVSWIRFHTPNRFQSRSRLQQVMPEQPISAGRSSQGIPVRRTKRIPVRHRLASTGFRPGYRFRRALGLGSSGSMIAQSMSSMTERAMGSPPLSSLRGRLWHAWKTVAESFC